MTPAAGTNQEREAAQSAGVELDLLIEAGAWADEARLRELAEQAVTAALQELGVDGDAAELSLVFTDDEHIRTLNAEWRGKDKPTNVLSFPALQPDKGAKRLPPMLGDIVLAYETAAGEAALEEKPFDHHLCHLIVHGLLHLLGYDHETDAEADEMEGAERRILGRLAIGDPYA